MNGTTAVATEQDSSLANPSARIAGEPLYDEETGVFIGTIRQGVLCVPRQKNGRQAVARVSVAWLCARLKASEQP